MNDRRVFLKLAGATGLSALPFGCSSANGGIQGDIAAGNVKDVPVGGLHVVSGEPLVVGHDTRGIYAMTTICTHAGCDMSRQGSIGANGLSCGCHGSRFDVDGNVIRGPASRALEHYAVDVAADGSITVHGDSPVDASTRAAVPSSAG